MRIKTSMGYPVWASVFISFTASDETKRKMYSSILVVGGGLMFHGVQEFLLHRIINKMPPSFRRLVDNVEVVTRPKVPQNYLSISQKRSQTCICLQKTDNFILQTDSVIYFIWHVCALGHGSSANLMERWSSAGMFGHHARNVDPPEGMAPLWCPNAPWKSCLCVVKNRLFLLEMVTQTVPLFSGLQKDEIGKLSSTFLQQIKEEWELFFQKKRFNSLNKLYT